MKNHLNAIKHKLDLIEIDLYTARKGHHLEIQELRSIIKDQEIKTEECLKNYEMIKANHNGNSSLSSINSINVDEI